MSLRAETVSRSILEEALDSLRRSRGVNGRSALAASESKRETAATASASAAARRVGRVRVLAWLVPAGGLCRRSPGFSPHRPYFAR